MKRLLVCLDHSERETFVFSEARHFAERMNARAVLLQVIVPDHGLTLPDAESDPKTHERPPKRRGGASPSSRATSRRPTSSRCAPAWARRGA